MAFYTFIRGFAFVEMVSTVFCPQKIQIIDGGDMESFCIGCALIHQRQNVKRNHSQCQTVANSLLN